MTRLDTGHIDADKIAGGASSSRPAGNDARGATGETGGGLFLTTGPRPDQSSVLTRERRSSPLPACGDAGACAPDGAAHERRRPVGLAADAGTDQFDIDPAVTPCGGPKDGSAESPPRSRQDYLAVYLPVETAILAAVGAAERGETPGSYISRAVVEHIKRNGGIAKLAKTLERTQAPDRAPGSVARPAGAPAGKAGDAAREAQPKETSRV